MSGSPGWGVSGAIETFPPLPSRASPVPSNLQSRTLPSPSAHSPQPWQLPGPSAYPLPSQVSQAVPTAYNPNTYGLMPSTRQSPVNRLWIQRDSGSTSDILKLPHSPGSTFETSRTSSKYTNNFTPSSTQALKPALPVSHFILFAYSPTLTNSPISDSHALINFPTKGRSTTTSHHWFLKNLLRGHPGSPRYFRRKRSSCGPLPTTPSLPNY